MTIFPTLEELRGMTVARIKSLDIRTRKDEELVQQVLDEKERASPQAQQVYRGDIPDIKTKEDELKWQKVVDKRAKSSRLEDHIQEKEINLDKVPEVVEPLVDDEGEVDERTEEEILSEIQELEGKKEELQAS